MGEAELVQESKQLVVHSHIITYGNAADATITNRIGEEIETLWNEAEGTVVIRESSYQVVFRITVHCQPQLPELEVLQNTNPRNNYFRIENFAQGNISFVDGLGSNTGYFLLENLYAGSTTAAHEYGHTLGLDHPTILDLRGRGRPGIMYPRGTLVDPLFQYDPTKRAGEPGGTMHPMHRRVMAEDIQLLKLHRLPFYGTKAVVGDYSNVYHWSHAAS